MKIKAILHTFAFYEEVSVNHLFDWEAVIDQRICIFTKNFIKIIKVTQIFTKMIQNVKIWVFAVHKMSVKRRNLFFELRKIISRINAQIYKSLLIDSHTLVFQEIEYGSNCKTFFGFKSLTKLTQLPFKLETFWHYHFPFHFLH